MLFPLLSTGVVVQLNKMIYEEAPSTVPDAQ